MRIVLYILTAFVVIVGAEALALYFMYGHRPRIAANALYTSCESAVTYDQRIAGCTKLIRWDVTHHYRTWRADLLQGNAYIAKGDEDELRGDRTGARIAYEAAVRDNDSILRRYPNYTIALNNRCWARELSGTSLNLALRDCNRAIALRPQADVLQSRAQVYLSMGRFKDAIADSNASLKMDPSISSALIVRGIAEDHAGNRMSGAKDIAAAAAIYPKIVSLYKSYGFSL